MEKQILISKIYVYLLGILIFFGLSLTSIYNYLLFHSLAEVFSIVVAFGIFVIAWNTRRFLDNNYLLFIGIAYLFVGALDLIHTLAYTGMGVFQGYETNLPTQLWISARYMESISLLIAPLLFRRELKVNLIFLGYALATSILLFSIFYWNIFPVCFIEGMGLTPFKKISEYIISLILLASIVLLFKNRREIDRGVFQLLVGSIILTIVSELAFTFYIDAYGFSNMVGHFFKILSFYFIYKAIIETGLTKPYTLLFRNLKESEERFRNIFAESPIGIGLRDPNGRLVEVNKASLEIFGVSNAAEVKGLEFFEDPNLSDEVKENLEKGETIRYEAPFDFEKVREHKLFATTKSGTIYLDVLITPLGLEQKGAQSGYLVQVQDITDRNKMEKELRKAKEELEIRVQERTAELAKTNEALKVEIAERKRAEEALRKQTDNLNKRIKEINCLYSISYYVEKEYLLLEEKLQSIVNLIPSGWQYPGITCARIVVEDKEYKTENFKETAWKQISDIIVHDEIVGAIEVFYLEEKPERDEGPFLKEERGLINAIVIELGEMLGHMRAEKALLRTTELLEKVFSSIDIMIAYMDKDFNFIRVNRAYAEVDERAPEFYVGKNHFALYPNEENETIFRKVVETGEPYFVFEKPFVYAEHPERGVTYWDWSLQPLKEPDGSVGGVVLSLVNVTERKRAHEAFLAASRYARSLIEACLDPLVTISADGKVMDVNSATELVTGVSREHLIGSDFSDYFTEPEKAREGYEQVFLQGSVRDYPLTIRHASGRLTDVLYNATVYKNEAGEVEGIFAAARDITDRKEIERRTHATNALLNLFSKISIRKEYLDAVVDLIRSWSGCQCIGIRVLNKQGYVPYDSYTGFSQEFWKSENWLSVNHDQCACIRVITGNPDPQDASVMTSGGSFCCNNTIAFVGKLSEEERLRFRGVCVKNGLLSVTVIPIHYRGVVFGAIHLADEKEGMVPMKVVEFIESMAPLIGEAVNRFTLEEEIRESESRLRLLSSQILTAQETERKRVAHELHDGIGQMLTAIKFKVEDTIQHKGKYKAKIKEKSLETIISLIQESIEEVRRIQMDLRPSILDDLGILATIGWFAREFKNIYSTICIERQIDIEEIEVPDPLKTVIFRIMQEALNNIAKHSRADLIHLSLRKTYGKIELIIEDNGMGFDLEDLLSTGNSKRGFGLSNMRERTEFSGGSFVMESIIGKGTIIRATWPIS